MHRILIRLLAISGFVTAVLCVITPDFVLANVDLIYFRATSGTDMIILEWETATELDNLGFNILRAESNDIAGAQVINPSLIPSLVGGQPIGATYEWQDEDVELNVAYFYWLQDVDFNGGVRNHGPAQASLAGSSVIPTSPPVNTAQPTLAATATSQASPTATLSPTEEIEPTPTLRQAATAIPSPTLLSVAPTLPAATALTEQAVPPSEPTSTGGSAIDEGDIQSAASASAEPGSEPAASAEEGDSLTAPPQEIGSALQAAPIESNQTPESLAGSSSANREARILGDPSSDSSSSGGALSGGGSSSVSRTVLALMVLAAAIFLILSAAIALWVVLNPKTAKPPDE